MSDFYGFDGLLEEMIKLTERLLNGQDAGLTVIPQLEKGSAERDELIERGDSFEYIVDAPGYEEGQLLVSVQEKEVEVKAPDFVARQALPSRVDPDSATSSYRNGVLSVRVKKQ